MPYTGDGKIIHSKKSKYDKRLKVKLVELTDRLNRKTYLVVIGKTIVLSTGRLPEARSEYARF